MTIQCKGCSHILFQGHDAIIDRKPRNKPGKLLPSYNVIETLIGTPCPICGRILRKPRAKDIEVYIKQKKP